MGIKFAFPNVPRPEGQSFYQFRVREIRTDGSKGPWLKRIERSWDEAHWIGSDMSYGWVVKPRGNAIAVSTEVSATFVSGCGDGH